MRYRRVILQKASRSWKCEDCHRTHCSIEWSSVLLHGICCITQIWTINSKNNAKNISHSFITVSWMCPAERQEALAHDNRSMASFAQIGENLTRFVGGNIFLSKLLWEVYFLNFYGLKLHVLSWWSTSTSSFYFHDWYETFPAVPLNIQYHSHCLSIKVKKHV